MMEDIVLVGFGGHAKSVADCIELQGKYHIVGYTDTEDKHVRYDFLGSDSELPSLFNVGIKYAAVGIGYMGRSLLREQIYNNLKQIGFLLPVIIDPSAIISKTATIQEGTLVGKGAIVNAGAVIGKMVIVNTHALVEHECILGDFVHVAVGAILCGQVEIGRAAFIGANSTIIQCKKINAGTLIPAGTVVR